MCLDSHCSSRLLAARCSPAAAAGGGDASPAPDHDRRTTAPAPAAARARPATPRASSSSRGESSPATLGPFQLDGRYLVRFEQYAPEDPKLDFSSQTPFTARLRRAGSHDARASSCSAPRRRSGTRELTMRGRYELDVSFGDFPYVVRFTPRR